jgi:hypothetical protein
LRGCATEIIAEYSGEELGSGVPPKVESPPPDCERDAVARSERRRQTGNESEDETEAGAQRAELGRFPLIRADRVGRHDFGSKTIDCPEVPEASYDNAEQSEATISFAIFH